MPKSVEDLQKFMKQDFSGNSGRFHTQKSKDCTMEETTRRVQKANHTSEKMGTLEELSPQEAENKKARAKAMRLLEHMDRTEKGLYEKLKQAGFSERAIADAMAYVKSFGYINDLRYAEAYLRTRIESKSRQQLTLELLKKGVDKHIIDLAWDEVIELEEPDERAMIRSIILKKCEPGTELDVKSMRRLYGQLMRKGFRGNDISAIFQELDITCNYKEENPEF